MEINYKNYQGLAAVTCKDLGDEEKNRIHMEMGIITETAEIIDILKKQLAYGKEVDWSHMTEEFGDSFWYIANYCEFIGFSFSNMVESILADLDDNDIAFSSIYNEMQNVLVSMPLNEDTIKYMLECYLTCLVNYTDINLDNCLSINIKKLQARYPEGFSSYYALNRNLDNEKKIIND
jgi:NTP pyrophosphatase (non-canonical NTP hydrolase)